MEGSYECICKNGFTGDGTDCRGKFVFCPFITLVVLNLFSSVYFALPFQ